MTAKIDTSLHGVSRAIEGLNVDGDVYAGAPQSSSAAQFGTLGINFRARKARDEAEWGAALATLTCDA